MAFWPSEALTGSRTAREEALTKTRGGCEEKQDGLARSFPYDNLCGAEVMPFWRKPEMLEVSETLSDINTTFGREAIGSGGGPRRESNKAKN
jgi:hypothetical protein